MLVHYPNIRQIGEKFNYRNGGLARQFMEFYLDKCDGFVIVVVHRPYDYQTAFGEYGLLWARVRC